MLNVFRYLQMEGIKRVKLHRALKLPSMYRPKLNPFVPATTMKLMFWVRKSHLICQRHVEMHISWSRSTGLGRPLLGRCSTATQTFCTFLNHLQFLVTMTRQSKSLKCWMRLFTVCRQLLKTTKNLRPRVRQLRAIVWRKACACFNSRLDSVNRHFAGPIRRRQLSVNGSVKDR